jgi:drug/metabolite transporter (DMT)-like permease
MNAIVLMALSALAFSICPLFYAITMQYTDPLSQGLYVQIAITLCAGILLSFSLKSPLAFIGSLRELFSMSFDVWLVIILSGVAAYIGTLFFLLSLNLMSPAGAAIIMECWPILAIFIAPVLIEKNWKPFETLDIVLIMFLMLGLFIISASDIGLSFEELLEDPLFLFTGKSYEEMYGIICAVLSAFCYAWAGVARPYFVEKLPNNYRQKYFGGTKNWKESLFAFWVTALTAIPLATLTVFIFGFDLSPLGNIIMPTIGLGLALTAMGCLYALSISLADTPNVNFLWYLSPLMAAIWLAIFGFSQITPMLVLGGFFIISANIILILKSRKPNVAP